MVQVASDGDLEREDLVQLELQLHDGLPHGDLHLFVVGILLRRLLVVVLLRGLNVLFNLATLVLQFTHFSLQLSDVLLLIKLALFSNEGFLNAVSDGAVIERLVAVLHHAHFVSHTHKQVATLGTVEGNLANDFVEALRVDFFADGADAAVSRLELRDAFVQVSSQVGHVEGCRWG